MTNTHYHAPHLSRRFVTVGLFASLAVSLLLSFLAIFFMDRISTTSDDLVTTYTEKMLETEDLRTSTERKAARSRAFLITGDQIHFQRFRQASVDMVRQLTHLDDMITEAHERRQLNLVKQRLAIYQNSLDKLMSMKMRRERDEKIARFFSAEVFPLKLSADQALDGLTALERKELEDARRASARETQRLTTYFQILAVVCLLTFLILAFLLRKSIRKQLDLQERIQSTLAASELAKTRFLDLVNHLDQAMVWEATSEPLHFQFMNQRSVELIGIRSEDLLTSPQHFLHAVHPEDRGTFLKMIENCKLLGTDQRCEHRMIPVNRPNLVVWFQTGVHVRKANGEVRLYGRSVKITAMKTAQVAYRESQERLRAILDNAPTAVYILDKDLRYRFVNAEWEKLAKVKIDGAIGRPIEDFLPVESRSQIRRNNLQVLQEMRPLEFEETFTVDGEERSFLAVKFPLRDEATGDYGICGISRDITDRKRSVTNLRQAVAAREEVLAVVSHDLKNPLNVVMMCAELIEKRPGSGQEFITKQAGKIKSSALRMRILIEDLLNLSKMSAGTFVLHRTTHCGAGIVSEVIEAFTAMAEEKSIRLVKAFADTRFSVNCDHDQFIRVFENILGNALKFTPSGGTITLSITFPRPGVVTYGIQDTGPGIPEELQSKVFNRYWQDEKTAYKGAGLGLAIAKGIVEAHGGTIGVTSRPGEGATFWFELPRES